MGEVANTGKAFLEDALRILDGIPERIVFTHLGNRQYTIQAVLEEEVDPEPVGIARAEPVPEGSGDSDAEPDESAGGV